MSVPRAATATFADTTAPTVTHAPVTSRAVNTAIPVSATITDNLAVQAATLFYRKTGDASFQSVAMGHSGDTYTATIPASAVTPVDVQYYLEARDAASNVRRSPAAGAGAPYVVVVGSSTFTDDPLVAGGTPIKAVHFTELLAAINARRTAHGLAAATWTAPAPAAGGTVRAKHLTDLRTGPAPTYADATITAGTTAIKASHLAELRTLVRELE
jgi:hypothetical protein